MELMRGLAFIALLFAGSAVGAELRQAEVCGDGTTHQSGYCPAVLSSPTGTATGATTGTVGATSDETDGTRYACATSTASALTCDQIQACSGGAAVAGSSAAETGSNSIALTGLTTDAAHYGQSCNESPEGWGSNPVASASFTPVNPGNDPYDLAGARTIPFAYSWPTEPTITTETSVSNNSELSAAIALGGRRITLNAGTYSGITINTNDTHLIISTGVTVSAAGGAALSIGGNRVRITGDRGATMTGGWQITGDDVFIEDQNQSSADGNNVLLLNGPARVAILSSTMEATRFAFQVYGGATDVIVANSSITASSQTAARIAKVTRLLLVDNLFDSENGSPAHAMRFGENYVNNLWFKGNQVEDNGTFGFQLSPVDPDNTGARVTSSGLYFYDSNLYSSGNTNFRIFAAVAGDSDYFENIALDSFTIYSGSKSPGSSIFPTGDENVSAAGQVNWTETNSGYQASTTAPTWTMNP